MRIHHTPQYTLTRDDIRSPGAVIREQRKRAGLTQLELATAVEVSARTLGSYESGEQSPTVDTMGRMLDVCLSQGDVDDA